tara:strand:- start:651 stop:1505 length:855 start_codon:yes stop_codon:yes gene_type:complete
MKYFKPLLFLFLATSILLGCKTNKKEETSAQVNTAANQEQNSASFSDKIDKSPRHQEWITLQSNDRELYVFVTYPEKSDAAKTVVAIHENRGLNDWARYFTDKLAAEGYIVLAPDLLSNSQDGIKRTTDFANSDAAREAIYALQEDNVTNDLDAVYDYAKNMDGANGKVSVVGFCWGGSQTFRYATNNNEIESANVFYGTAPDDEKALHQINSPIYGYYGGEDNRVNSTIEKTKSVMDEAGKTYEYEIYDGAGHAFMRRGAEVDSDAANKEAHDKAWKRLLSVL